MSTQNGWTIGHWVAGSTETEVAAAWSRAFDGAGDHAGEKRAGNAQPRAETLRLKRRRTEPEDSELGLSMLGLIEGVAEESTSSYEDSGPPTGDESSSNPASAAAVDDDGEAGERSSSVEDTANGRGNGRSAAVDTYGMRAQPKAWMSDPKTTPEAQPGWLGHVKDTAGMYSITMADEVRPYRLWETDSGVLATTLGTLLPRGYRVLSDEYPATPWICPVRSCRLLYPTRASLAGHFSVKHARSLFNDNGNGTLTMVGTYEKPVPGCPTLVGVVISKNPGSSTEPMALPALPGLATKAPAQLPGAAAESTTQAAPPAAPPAAPKAPAYSNGITFSVSDLKKHSLPNDSGTEAVKELVAAKDKEGTLFGEKGSTAALPAAAAAIGTGSPAAAVETSRATSSRSPVAADAPPTPVVIRDLRKPIPGDEDKMWAYIKPFLRNTPRPPATGHVPEVLGLPRVRDIQWNSEWKNGFFESFPRDVTALIMYLTGERPPLQCSRCEKKGGPFHGCIVLPSEKHIGNIVSCANCWYHGRQAYCSLQADLRVRSTKALREWPADPVRVTEPAETSAGYAAGAATERFQRESQLAARFTKALTEATPSAAAAEAQPSPAPAPASAPTVRTQPAHRSAAAPAAPVGPPYSSVMMTGCSQMPSEALEMEEWEIGPGLVPSQAEPRDNVAFSNAYLSTSQAVSVADGISFRVETIRPGTSRTFEADRFTTRICSLASGKLRVQMQGEPELVIGPNGMVKIRPGVGCTVKNCVYVDCVMHMSIVTTEET